MLIIDIADPIGSALLMSYNPLRFRPLLDSSVTPSMRGSRYLSQGGSHRKRTRLII